MEYQEAIEIAEMCRPDKYGSVNPPTNPAVLLEAARVAYLEHGSSAKVKSIVAWLALILNISFATEWVQSFEEPTWLEE